MARYTPDELNSLANQQSAIANINSNLEDIAAALDDTLSRSGVTPNQMEADLDMNSNDILNVKKLSVQELEVGTVNADLSKVIKVPSDTVGVDTELPAPVPSVLWGWNADGTAPAYYDLTGEGGLPTAASLVSYTQSGTGAVAQTVEGRLRKVVFASDFGAVGDGVTDDTAALQLALDRAEGGLLKLGSGTFKVTGQLTVPKDTSIMGDGPEVTIITAAGDVTGTYTDGAVLYIAGDAPVGIPSTAADVPRGTTQIQFATAHGLAAGDRILLYKSSDYSWSPWRSSYRAGEYCTVRSVESSVLATMEGGVFDLYAIVMSAYLVNGYTGGSIANFTVLAPGEGANMLVKAIEIEYAHQYHIDNIHARNGGATSMTIGRSYQVMGNGIIAHQIAPDTGAGTQYGLSIGNCQDVQLINCHFTGFRHGITLGGGDTFSIPNRSVHVSNFIARSMATSIAAADWHGNVEFCSYRNGTVYGGGLNIAGNNNHISNISSYGENQLFILGREILGCHHVVENCYITSYREDENRGIIDIGGNSAPLSSDTYYDGTFVFRNITMITPRSQRNGINIRNRGFTGEWRVEVDGMTYYTEDVLGPSYSAVAINTVSGDPPEQVSSTNIRMSPTSNDASGIRLGGVGDTDAQVRTDSMSGVETVTTATNVNEVSVLVTFPRKFPKAPSVLVSASDKNTGSDRCMPYVSNVTTDDVLLVYARVDAVATDFDAIADIDLHWVATLQEF